MSSPTAHPALLAEPGPEDLRAAWAARLEPADAAEELALASLVAAHWRRARLDAIEDRLLRSLLDGSVADGLPSLATVCRYAARLAKDLELARERLQRLRDERPRHLPAERVRPTAALDPTGADRRPLTRDEGRWTPPEAAEALAGYEAPEPAAPTVRPVEPGPSGEPPPEDGAREHGPAGGFRPAAAFAPAPFSAPAAPEPVPAGTPAAARAAIEAAVAELLAEFARPGAPTSGAAAAPLAA